VNRPKLAGILSIVSGGIGIVTSGIYLAIILSLEYVFEGIAFYTAPMPVEFYTLMTVFYGALAISELIFSALAITGGVFTIKRKQWAVALAGCITAIFVFFPCGVAAVVLIAPTRADFSATKQLATT